MSSAAKDKSHLTRIGLVIWVLGLMMAGIIYWRGQAESAQLLREQGLAIGANGYQDGTLAFTDSKKSNRDMEIYSGKLGVFVAKWTESWESLPPYEARAIVIGGLATLIALGCFLAERFL